MSKYAGITITDDEEQALAYVVPDVAAWIENAVSVFGENAQAVVLSKIAKAEAIVAKVPEEAYTTRAERDAAYEAEMETAAKEAAEAQASLVNRVADMEKRVAALEKG